MSQGALLRTKHLNKKSRYCQSCKPNPNLSQLAILDARSIVTGEYPIKNLEQTNSISIFAGLSEHKYSRVVDIVLEAPNKDPLDDKWIEIKSYQRDYKNVKTAYKNAKRHPLQIKWNQLKTGSGIDIKNSTIPRRQFFLDRVHARKDKGFENQMQ